MIRPRFISGQSFTDNEVSAAGRVAIEIIVLVEGLVTGGLTYVLDPKLVRPARESIREEEEEEEKEEEERERKHRQIRLKIDLG